MGCAFGAFTLQGPLLQGNKWRDRETSCERRVQRRLSQNANTNYARPATAKRSSLAVLAVHRAPTRFRPTLRALHTSLHMATHQTGKKCTAARMPT